jgi:Flp pilus assembly pilin Flp
MTHTPRRRPRAAPPLRLTAHRARQLFGDETGAATAEYAIATMAAVAFAGLLVVIMRSDEVRGILTDLVRRALTVA